MSLYDDWKTTEPDDGGVIQCSDCERPASESCGPCGAFLCRSCEDGRHVCEAQAGEVAQ